MDLEHSLNFLLGMAQPATNAQPDPVRDILGMVGPLICIVVAFYFLAIRPQKKRERALTELLKSVKRGDKIATSSGIIGFVTNVGEKTVTIRTGDAKIEITKAAVAEITERGTGDSKEP
jgi:preprotein translocase subunit YajC